MKRFTSSLDQLSQIITYCVIALGIVLLIIGYIAYKKSGGEPMVLISIALGPVILGSLTIAMYYLQPRSVGLDDNSITIGRKLHPVSISLSDISSVRALDKGELSGTIRTFGNGGLLGYTGLYYNKKLGSMNWYCTQRKNYILIEKKDHKKIIITPDNPIEFLQALHIINPSVAASL